jgi:cation transport ATPase
VPVQPVLAHKLTRRPARTAARAQLLVALGTSAAWVYSLMAMVLLVQAGGAHGGGGAMEAGYHVYFETSALIITFVCLGARGRSAGG